MEDPLHWWLKITLMKIKKTKLVWGHRLNKKVIIDDWIKLDGPSSLSFLRFMGSTVVCMHNKLAKVLAARFKKVLPFLISESVYFYWW